MTIQTISSPDAAKSQRGYSLIELSIALAILSVIIVGSLMGVQRILANNRANNILQTVPRINAALIAGTLGGAGGGAISTNLAVQLGAFDPTTVTGTGAAQTVRNDFGGQYRVASNAAVVNNVPINGGYFIHITNIPSSVCPIMANGLSALTDGIWIGPAATFATPAADANAFATPNNVGTVLKAPGGNLNIANVGTGCATPNSTLVAFIPLG